MKSMAVDANESPGWPEASALLGLPAGSSALTALRILMERLRDPESGCPWDLEQTFASVAPYTLEEAYEVVDAIDRGDLGELREELGDLLLQVVFHARMAEEQGAFDLEDVARGIVAKMLRRHPHVFGDREAADAQAVSRLWEAIKREEKSGGVAAGQSAPSLLDGLPTRLPALQRAEKLQSRAARIGFDWPDIHAVLEKVEEERAELAEALASGDLEAARDELADLLFVMTHLGRFLAVDSESLLRRACAKFERRFRFMESAAGEHGLERLNLEQQEALWQRAKRAGL
jgi:nucleoside triphosphate diphosphatase